MRNLELTITKFDTAINVMVSGSVVSIDAHDFSESLLELAEQGKELTLDMTRVTDIGHSGLNALLLTNEALTEMDSEFKVTMDDESGAYQFLSNLNDRIPIQNTNNVCLKYAA